MKYDKIETGVNLRQLRIENKLSPGEVSDIVYNATGKRK